MAFKMRGITPLKQTETTETIETTTDDALKTDNEVVMAAFDAFADSKKGILKQTNKEETKRLYDIYVKLRDAAGEKHTQKSPE